MGQEEQEERLIELGALLRDRRDELGLRRSDVARRVGVTPAYIARIEDAAPRPSGKRTRPSQAVLRRWTGALGMSGGSRTQILERAGYAPPSGSGPPISSTVRERGADYEGNAPDEHALVGE